MQARLKFNMAIEVRQVTIKSFVSEKDEKKSASSGREQEERMKRELLSECRQMMLDLMRNTRER